MAGIAGIAGFTVKNPQPLSHTCQSTPAFVVSVASVVTAAVRFTVAFVWICAGNDGTKPTERTVGGLIVMALELRLTLGFATDVAVIVTEVPVTSTEVPAGVTGGAV